MFFILAFRKWIDILFSQDNVEAAKAEGIIRRMSPKVLEILKDRDSPSIIRPGIGDTASIWKKFNTGRSMAFGSAFEDLHLLKEERTLLGERKIMDTARISW